MSRSGVARAPVESVNRENIAPGPEEVATCGDVDVLELDGLGVRVRASGLRVPLRRLRSVPARDGLSVQVRDKAVVVLHRENQEAELADLVDREGDPQIDRSVLTAHGDDVGADQLLVPRAVLVPDARRSLLPARIIKRRLHPVEPEITARRHVGTSRGAGRKECLQGGAHSDLGRRGHLASDQPWIAAIQRVIDRALDDLLHGQSESGVDRPAVPAERRRVDARVESFSLVLIEDDRAALREVLFEEAIALLHPVDIALEELERPAHSVHVTTVVPPASGLRDERLEHFVRPLLPTLDHFLGRQQSSVEEVPMYVIGETQAELVARPQAPKQAARSARLVEAQTIVGERD